MNEARAVTEPYHQPAYGTTVTVTGPPSSVRPPALHADVSVEAARRKKLERLLRYGLRPPFAGRRLSRTADGKVRLELRRPWHTGQRDITFEPVEFLRRLAAAIPKPRQNMVRFHGVFAPNAKLRSALKTLLPAPSRQQPLPPLPLQIDPDDQTTVVATADDSTELPVRYRRPWAELLARIFGHQILVCPHCQGRLDRTQLVEEPVVILLDAIEQLRAALRTRRRRRKAPGGRRGKAGGR